MRVEYHPLSVSDLNRAVEYYNRQRVGLGDELRDEVYAAIERIRTNPAQYPVVDLGLRRCLVHRFPYAVLFRIVGEDAVRVLVIRHHGHHPGVGRGRS